MALGSTNLKEEIGTDQKPTEISQITKASEPSSNVEPIKVKFPPVPPVPPCSPKSARISSPQQTFLSKRDSDSQSIVGPTPYKLISQANVIYPNHIPEGELMAAKSGNSAKPPTPVRLLKDCFPINYGAKTVNEKAKNSNFCTQKDHESSQDEQDEAPTTCQKTSERKGSENPILPVSCFAERFPVRMWVPKQSQVSGSPEIENDLSGEISDNEDDPPFRIVIPTNTGLDRPLRIILEDGLSVEEDSSDLSRLESFKGQYKANKYSQRELSDSDSEEKDLNESSEIQKKIERRSPAPKRSTIAVHKPVKPLCAKMMMDLTHT